MDVATPTMEGLILPERRDLYYGGAWHAARSGRQTDVLSPATGALLCRIADAGPEDAEAAIAAA